MVFIEMNDGRRENVLQFSEITVDGTDVLYKPARGSLTPVIEHFDTEAGAKARYTELQSVLLVAHK